MRCTPAGAVNARAQPVAEMQAAWYHWRLRTRRRHSRLGGCRAALDAIGFGPRRARRFGRVSDKPLSAPSWPTCTMSGRPATVAISPKHLWRCSSPTAIMLSSPQSAAASRHRRTRRRSPPLHGTLPRDPPHSRGDHPPTDQVMWHKWISAPLAWGSPWVCTPRLERAIALGIRPTRVGITRWSFGRAKHAPHAWGSPRQVLRAQPGHRHSPHSRGDHPPEQRTAPPRPQIRPTRVGIALSPGCSRGSTPYPPHSRGDHPERYYYGGPSVIIRPTRVGITRMTQPHHRTG